MALVDLHESLLGFDVRLVGGDVSALHALAEVGQRTPEFAEQAVVEMEALTRKRSLQTFQGVLADVVVDQQVVAVRPGRHHQPFQALQQQQGAFRLPGGQGMENDFAVFFEVAGAHGRTRRNLAQYSPPARAVALHTPPPDQRPCRICKPFSRFSAWLTWKSSL